jgi:MFS transporter, ACDE family, multidrug resistance protein
LATRLWRRVSVRGIVPATIGGLPFRQGLAFLSLFFLPTVAQATLLTVLPLGALRLLGSPQAVTLLYGGAGLASVAGRFSIPALVGLIGRRSVFTLGAALLATSSALFALDRLPAFAAGMVLTAFAFACVEITSQLYLLDHAPRQALRHFEPMRIFSSAAPWTFGPWLGVHLQQHVAFIAPFVIAGVAAILLVILFRALRLGEGAAVAGLRRQTINPVRYLPRFFSQPRLLLAWTLAATRSSWWSMFFVYAPILSVTSGLGAEAGGIVASIGTGWTWLVPIWGWAGRRFGLRRLLQLGYAAAGVLSIAAALTFGGLPWLGAALLVMASFAAGTIDGAGNLLFLRDVHPYERSEMTTVFASFREVTQVGPPVVCSALLVFFSLPSVFMAAGAVMLASSALCGRIPRRL